MSSLFYKHDHLSFQEKKDLMIYAKSLCTTWYFDRLEEGCLARKPVDIDFNDAINLFKKEHLFTLVLRTYPNLYAEIGYSSLGSPSNYLWINVSFEDFQLIINKFKLIR